MSRPLLDTLTHTVKKRKYAHLQTCIYLLVRQGGRLPSTAKNLVGGEGKEAEGMEKIRGTEIGG